MLEIEKFAFDALVSRIKPKMYWEVGVHSGGSLQVAAGGSTTVLGFAILDVSDRFTVPENVTLIVGDSAVELPTAVAAANNGFAPMPDLILIDGEHTASGVERDLRAILELKATSPIYVLWYDNGNYGRRSGMMAVPFAGCATVRTVELDFVPGRVMTILEEPIDVWGGFASLCLFLTNPIPTELFPSGPQLN